MPVFEYRATKADGESVKGTLFGASLNAAADDLARRGFQVEHIALAEAAGDPVPRSFEGAPPARAAPRSAGGASEAAVQQTEPRPSDPLLERRSVLVTDVLGPLLQVPLSQLHFFFRQLSTMLSAGVSPVQSLDTLSKQTSSSRLKAAISELKEHTLAGRPISFGMQRYPEIFTPIMVSIVRVGEEMGTQDRALRLVAQHVEEEIELRNLYRRVTFWPKFLLVVAVVIVLGTNGIIAALGKTGGLPTAMLTTLLALAPILFLLFLFFRVGARNPQVRTIYDEALQRIPFLGKTLHQFAMAKFGRAFGAMYGGGVPVGRAVALAADACGNEYLRARMLPAAKEIEEGGSVSEAFARTGAFSQIVLDMTRTGEESGTLDQMLDKVSEFYEDEAKTRSVQMGYVIGVVVYLIVAIFIVLTVILPFWQGYFGGITSSVEGAFAIPAP